MTRRACVFLMFCALSAGVAGAQSDKNFVAGAGALLRVDVADRPDLSNIYRVDPAGMLALPQVGEISVQGLSLREVSDAVADRLRVTGGKPPKVSVSFDRSLQSVFVAGEVRSPGLIVMKGPLSLIKVLARAGSLTSAASDEIDVIHDEIPGDATASAIETRRTVNVRDLRAGRDVLLHDGDTVFVPKAALFYIYGEVRHPGAYVLTPGMTVIQAIALAGGLTDRGSDSGVRIIRSIDGRASEMDADPGRLVLADDTIRVRQRRF